MPATIARNGPDLIIADPPLLQPSTSRWVVMLWADPLRARFRLLQQGPNGAPVVDVDEVVAWGQPMPLTIPSALGRQVTGRLLQLQGPLATPRQRLAAARGRIDRKPLRLRRP